MRIFTLVLLGVILAFAHGFSAVVWSEEKTTNQIFLSDN